MVVMEQANARQQPGSLPSCADACVCSKVQTPMVVMELRPQLTLGYGLPGGLWATVAWHTPVTRLGVSGAVSCLCLWQRVAKTDA